MDHRPCTPLTIDPSHLLLAIPKKGRLHDRSIQLLNEIGLQFKRPNRSDIAHCTAAPVSLVFLNVVDIPVFVAEGSVDGGIVGQDVIAETGRVLKDQQLLGFGRCVLAVQAPSHLKMSPADLIGKRIVTSFPKLTRKFFAALESNHCDNKGRVKRIEAIICDDGVNKCMNERKDRNHLDDDDDNDDSLDNEVNQINHGSLNGDSETSGGSTTPDFPHLKTRILTVSGSVEASVSLGLSEGVVDLVETGDTMRLAGLQQIGVVMKSEAAFICNPHTKHGKWLTVIRKRIEGFLTAQKYQMISYNIPKEKLDQAVFLTPGLRSPTITNLADLNWLSITVVVERSRILDIIDDLDLLGAKDILTFDFRHCRIGSTIETPTRKAERIEF